MTPSVTKESLCYALAIIIKILIIDKRRFSAVKWLPHLALLHQPWNILYKYRPFYISGLGDAGRALSPTLSERLLGRLYSVLGDPR